MLATNSAIDSKCTGGSRRPLGTTIDVVRRISPTEPVSDVRRVKILECGEPLVDYREACPDLFIDPPRFDYRRVTYVRARVAAMLNEAIRRLPKGYRLSIIEGWRPPHIQERMYRWSWRRFQERHPDWSDVKLRRVVNRFTAPMNSKVPPPHSTGGAVDLILADADGNRLDMTSPYDRKDPQSFPTHVLGLSDEARRHRQILIDVLTPTGLTNYPSEYWHWSFGDQGWAYRTGTESAIYGPTSPAGYEPPPEEVSSEPLKRLDEDRTHHAA